jgi:hypothetical protein
MARAPDETFISPCLSGGYLRKTARNLDKLIEFIKSVNADIIGLVEVDSGSFRSGRRTWPK